MQQMTMHVGVDSFLTNTGIKSMDLLVGRMHKWAAYRSFCGRKDRRGCEFENLGLEHGGSSRRHPTSRVLGGPHDALCRRPSKLSPSSRRCHPSETRKVYKPNSQ